MRGLAMGMRAQGAGPSAHQDGGLAACRRRRHARASSGCHSRWLARVILTVVTTVSANTRSESHPVTRSEI
jgi:hypothetical protein